MDIIIADDRKPWMVEEDKRMACMRCSLYKSCSSLLGFDCKKLGGDMIPRLRKRGQGYEKEKSKKTVRR